jgi:response regulator of citrate/malate metabolism
MLEQSNERFRCIRIATKTAKNIHEGAKALSEEGPWDILYLDYYLNDFSPRRNGDKILHWLDHNRQYMPKVIVPNSSDEERNKELLGIIKELELYYATDAD